MGGKGWVPTELNEVASVRTVSGGTSPTAVTFLPPEIVEYTEDEPTRVDSSVTSWPSSVFVVVFLVSTSTKTDTEASPSLKTRCETGSVDPGITWAERAAILKPGGSFNAFHTSEAFSGGSFPGCAALRSHWKPSVDTSGLNSESGIRDDNVRLANTICSMTRPCPSHSCVFSGIAVVSSIHNRYPYRNSSLGETVITRVSRRFRRVLATSWMS